MAIGWSCMGEINIANKGPRDGETGPMLGDAGLSSQWASSLELLQSIAVASHDGKELYHSSDNGVATLSSYERHLGVDLGKICSLVRNAFGPSRYLVADIGGNEGGAVAELCRQQNDFEPFCIDPNPSLAINGLPSERMIVAAAENMIPVPDNTFHLMLSHNALTCTDLSRSLPEIGRILAPAGLGVLDIEFWTDLEPNALLGINLGASVQLHFVAKQRGPMSLEQAFKEIGNMSETQKSHFEMSGCFFMIKDKP